MIAPIAAVSPEGVPSVDLSKLGYADPIRSRSTAELTPEHAGCQAAVMFEGGDSARPVVLGLIQDPLDGYIQAPTVESPEPPSVREENGRYVVEADRELELRCGSASITLRADGRVRVRGTDVTTRSSGTHRIKGASVRIN